VEEKRVGEEEFSFNGHYLCIKLHKLVEFFLAKRGKKGVFKIIFSDLFQTHGI
jgi:hypothetical protein